MENYIAMTPKEIVAYLDEYIIGQNDAKKIVAIALRNRYRRLQLPKEIQEEVMPKNILSGLGLETMVISLCMKIMSVLITVILYGRMIEIYLYVSVAPIPAATVTNREWGTIGTNYLKGLVALAFQGFFIMVCVAIYAVLVASVAVAGNLHSALWSVAAYTVILCFSLFKTGSLSKSIFNAH